MKTTVTAVLCIVFCLKIQAQHYKYIDSAKVMGLNAYLNKIADSPVYKLVEIKKYVPGIALDIRYATTNNFMHRKMYKEAKAFARLPVANALKAVEADLKKLGLGLKIYDAYRPYTVTVDFYERAHDTNFVADPRKGSRHNRGCAIDLTVIDLKTGKELDMPTGFDSFSENAADNYANLPKNEIANRELLKSVMQAHGFKIYRTEWWHYDYEGWPTFPLLDIAFEEIK
jgi:D-alanyl-D-alanine dipeptidase